VASERALLADSRFILDDDLRDGGWATLKSEEDEVEFGLQRFESKGVGDSDSSSKYNVVGDLGGKHVSHT